MIKRLKISFGIALFFAAILSSGSVFGQKSPLTQEPVDFVNPYMGNISHLLVPTYPTVHLPNSMLRVYPERGDFTADKIKGLPIVVTSHRGSSAFNLSFVQGAITKPAPVVSYTYDNEVIKPYFYSVFLDEAEIGVRFAPSAQSAIYEIDFSKSGAPSMILNSVRGEMSVDGNAISGFQQIGANTNIFLYTETDIAPTQTAVLTNGAMEMDMKSATGRNAAIVASFPASTKKLKVRYGISFISVDQAKKNLKREITDYNLDRIAAQGRKLWNDKLCKIMVTGSSETDKTVLYTSLYRTYERMICLSEDGRYYSAFDGAIHDDNGMPFYTDDWIWDTYRATHPLRVIIEPKMEVDMVNSFIRMAEQMPNFWMPTFPEVTGDSRRMNSNHGVATVIDSYAKGLKGFDLEKAYLACRNAITEKTLAPWSAKPAGVLDAFYKEKGYFPALVPGETETAPEVSRGEKRQPVAVTLGTVYDEWCLSQIAKALNKKEDHEYFAKRSLNYREIFNSTTHFFHPKDKDGKFLEPFNYITSGGQGARDTYDENNGWVYRWDVPHNIADLVYLMGGKDQFAANLEAMYNTPLGQSKFGFYAQLPDHTGNVGQFSMANEPSLHIPYLYNYIGQPWRTQKRIRTLIEQWFRNDLMGVPGDEDGGGMSAFVVFSSLGFYPVTPGLPMYVIGSPMFETAKIKLENGKIFEVVCKNYSPDNKYIQSATLNGKPWNKSWFSHSDLMSGGKIEFVMGANANKAWASDAAALPPSFDMK